MAVEQWVRAEIDAVVEDWLRGRRIFTAFEVSREMRGRGIKIRHRELRDDVHQSLQLAAGRYGYTRTLRDIDGTVEAWLYHHWKDNAWSHTPLPREVSAVNSGFTGTDNYDSPLLPATTAAYSSGVAIASRPAMLQKPTAATMAEPPATMDDPRLTVRHDNITQLELRPDETAIVVCNELETDVIIHNAKPTAAARPTTTQRAEQHTTSRIGPWLMSWVCTILDC